MLHKKLLDVSVLYSSYTMFLVDHNLWSTLPPPPPSLSRHERCGHLFFGQGFLQKVSSLSRRRRRLSLSSHSLEISSSLYVMTRKK